MKLRVKARTANQVPKGKGAAKKKKASARPADVLTERQNFFKLPRISLVLLPDASCAERGYSSYNRFHMAARATLKTGTARNAFAIKNYGSPSGAGLHVKELYDERIGLIKSEAQSSSGGVARNPPAGKRGCAFAKNDGSCEQQAR